jgi:hypothetical protein
MLVPPVRLRLAAAALKQPGHGRAGARTAARTEWSEPEAAVRRERLSTELEGDRQGVLGVSLRQVLDSAGCGRQRFRQADEESGARDERYGWLCDCKDQNVPAAARTLGVDIHGLTATGPDEFGRAFAEAKKASVGGGRDRHDLDE